MGISSSDAVILAQLALKEQRLSVAAVEKSGNLQILRVAAPNGAVISSVLLAPTLLELDETEATAQIRAAVLSACRAAASEPSVRKTQAEVQNEEGQKGQAQAALLAVQAPAAPSVPGVPQEPIGGELE